MEKISETGGVMSNYSWIEPKKVYRVYLAKKVKLTESAPKLIAFHSPTLSGFANNPPSPPPPPGPLVLVRFTIRLDRRGKGRSKLAQCFLYSHLQRGWLSFFLFWLQNVQSILSQQPPAYQWYKSLKIYRKKHIKIINIRWTICLG